VVKNEVSEERPARVLAETAAPVVLTVLVGGLMVVGWALSAV
jgi:hypothetical protein